MNQDNDVSEKAVALLKAVLASDLNHVTTLLDTGTNPNCGFDGIPLVTIAAAQNAPLEIVAELVEHGAELGQRVQAPACPGQYPHMLAKNPEVKQYLLTRYLDDALRGRNAPIRAFENHTLKQFNQDYRRLPLTKPKASSPEDEDGMDDNGVILIQINHDQPICLLENKDELIRRAMENPLDLEEKRQDPRWAGYHLN